MKPRELISILSPFAKLSNKNAMSATYRSLQISPTHIRGVSSFAKLEATLDPKKPPLYEGDPFVIDTTSLIAVLRTLPNDHDFEFEIAGGIVMDWAIGGLASGRISLIAPDQIEKWATWKAVPGTYKPTKAFTDALQLGALSCDQASLLSQKRHGILIDNREKQTAICSFDEMTLSIATIDRITTDAEVIKLPYAGAELLAEIIAEGQGSLFFDNQKVLYKDKLYSATITQIPDLKDDVTSIAKPFMVKPKLVAEIDHERIGAFITRIKSISEAFTDAMITVKLRPRKKDGSDLVLEYQTASAASDEWFAIGSIPTKEPMEAAIAGWKIARALDHTDHLIFDFLQDEGVLIFAGSDPDFHYLMSKKGGA